ncbi:site-specific integrase [Ruminiclostridium papyrosolvens]|uniref:site-specific integrase n=1 Tax=Ruminiclostridium papyrosolvens TaxID=29362 RepID=UPI000687208F|nr:site-specific integrase [Ruminiclostridium papyrosolvens]
MLEFYNNLSEDGIRLDSKYKAKKEFNELLKTLEISLYDLQKISLVDIRTLKRVAKSETISMSTAVKIIDSLKQNIKKIKIEDYFEVIETGKLSDQTIKHHHRLISAMLEKAVKWQLLLNNPAERVEPPKVVKGEVPHYDESQAVTLLNYLEKEPIKFQAMVNLALYAQMREGEIMGLEWKDINMKERTINIRQAAQYIPKRGVFIKEPKNESSKRTVTVPKNVMEILKELRKIQMQEEKEAGTRWKKNNNEQNTDANEVRKFIFTTWDGELMHPYTPTKQFKKFIDLYGLPKLTFHGLRHTGITLLLGNGADIDSVSRRAGHSQRSTTLNIYSHSLRSKDVANANKLGNILNKSKKEKLGKKA